MGEHHKPVLGWRRAAWAGEGGLSPHKAGLPLVSAVDARASRGHLTPNRRECAVWQPSVTCINTDPSLI